MHSAIGLARSCLDHAVQGWPQIGGVFAAVRQAFTVLDAGNQLKQITDVNDFSNTHVAHVAHHEKPLTDRALDEKNLKIWVTTLSGLRT